MKKITRLVLLQYVYFFNNAQRYKVKNNDNHGYLYLVKLPLKIYESQICGHLSHKNLWKQRMKLLDGMVCLKYNQRCG